MATESESGSPKTSEIPEYSNNQTPSLSIPKTQKSEPIAISPITSSVESRSPIKASRYSLEKGHGRSYGVLFLKEPDDILPSTKPSTKKISLISKTSSRNKNNQYPKFFGKMSGSDSSSSSSQPFPHKDENKSSISWAEINQSLLTYLAKEVVKEFMDKYIEHSKTSEDTPVNICNLLSYIQDKKNTVEENKDVLTFKLIKRTLKYIYPDEHLKLANNPQSETQNTITNGI